MRQVLSWRFVATIGALFALTVIVYFAFGNRQSVAEVVEDQQVQTRRADLITLTLGSTSDGFSIQGGRSTGTLSVQVLPVGFADPVALTIYPGTPGEVTCLDLATPCAMLAQTLGDTVSWFAIVPLAAGFKIQLPAVEELDAGYAHLVNGWEVPYATVIDRRCDSPAESFSEFLRLVPNHTSIYDLGRGALTAVTC
jgi:hypothetical protein